MLIFLIAFCLTICPLWAAEIDTTVEPKSLVSDYSKNILRDLESINYTFQSDIQEYNELTDLVENFDNLGLLEKYSEYYYLIDLKSAAASLSKIQEEYKTNKGQKKLQQIDNNIKRRIYSEVASLNKISNILAKAIDELTILQEESVSSALLDWSTYQVCKNIYTLLVKSKEVHHIDRYKASYIVSTMSSHYDYSGQLTTQINNCFADLCFHFYTCKQFSQLFDYYLNRLSPYVVAHDAYFSGIRQWWRERHLLSKVDPKELDVPAEIINQKLDDKSSQKNARKVKKRFETTHSEEIAKDDVINFNEAFGNLTSPQAATITVPEPLSDTPLLKPIFERHREKVKTRGIAGEKRNVKAQRLESRTKPAAESSSSLSSQPTYVVSERALKALLFVEGKTSQGSFSLQDFCNGFADVIDLNPTHFINKACYLSSGSKIRFFVQFSNGSWRKVAPHVAHMKDSMTEIPREYRKDFIRVFEMMGISSSNVKTANN